MEYQQVFQRNMRELKGNDSLATFAEKCAIKYGTMRNYIEGSTSPSLDALVSIKEANGVSIGELVGEQPLQQKGGGHSAVNSSGTIQAGGSIQGASINLAGQELTAAEQALIEKLRKVGSPIMIEKIMKQLEELENFVLGK